MDSAVLADLADRYKMDPADRALLVRLGQGPGSTMATLSAPIGATAGLTNPGPDGPLAPPGSDIAVSSRYADRGPIGMGGMGEIRRVYDHALKRTMAMKIIRADRCDDPLTQARFVEEAQANAQLQHPGIVPVHELGRLDDGRLYFTMKEVLGRTMADVIAEVHAASVHEWTPSASGWTFRRVISALQQICRTVAFAHSRGIVHRDLKPRNVMLGAFGEALVLDWGLAKAHGQIDSIASSDTVVTGRTVDTRDGAVAGTPAFMAPEQASGHTGTTDPRSDVYGLGAILYTVLSNRDPYSGDDPSELVRRVLAGPPPPPGRSDGPVAPEELVDLCRWAMSRDPADRPASASVLADEVTGWLDGSRARERALAAVAAADRRHTASEQLRDRATVLEIEAEAMLADVASWETEELKAPGWAKADEARALRLDAGLEDLEMQQILREALDQAPELAEAHDRLAAHHLALHRRAEARRDAGEAAQQEALVRRHHRGRHTAYLEGNGALTLHTDPPGLAAELFAYRTTNRRLVPVWDRSLGTTPLERISLPLGSYLVRIRTPSGPPVDYPVRIGRLEHWDGVPPGGSDPLVVPMPPPDLGPDTVYVPPGWFLAGGDPLAYGGLPRQRLWLDGLLVRRFCVTLAEYTTFLADRMATGHTAEAHRYLPRAGDAAAPVGVRLEGGTVKRVTDVAGWWLPDWPVIHVDWWSARAFARWYADRTGQPWRLLGELEWEKAARGVDGRRYPWGDQLDPSWCLVTDSHRGPRTPAVVDSHPVDASPYGVRGMGGNVADWCADAYRPQGPPRPGDRVRSPPDLGDPHSDVLRVVRGGVWDYLSARRSRSAGRDRRAASFRYSLFGFRLARSWP